MFMFLMYEQCICYPILVCFSDQTSMHRACEGDVCISWSSLVVSLR
jgi:hypothetical protein